MHIARYLMAATAAILPTCSAFAEDVAPEYRQEVAVAMRAALTSPATVQGAEISRIIDTSVVKGEPRYCVRIGNEDFMFMIIYGQAIGPFARDCNRDNVAWTPFVELTP